MKKIDEYNKNELKTIIDSCSSFKEFLNKINYSSSGNAYKVIKNKLNNLGVEFEFLTKNSWSSKEKTNEEVFKINSHFCNKALKNKILKFNLLEYKCVECGNIGEWMGRPLSLQLDHINGDSTDNRLENLRFLCANCHSQTETYSGKNNKK